MQVDVSRPFVRIERTIDAPQSAVFTAWTKPAALMEWWGPKGITAVAADLDVRPGGRYSITMQSAKGTPFVLSGEYREVVESQKLVKTWCYRGEAITDPVDSIVTVEFVAERGGSATRLILTQEFMGEPPDLEGRDRGWRSSFERLEEYITRVEH